MLQTIVATIFVIGLLVIFHEFGHFSTAKLVGMRVNEFAVGFGPKLLSYKRGDTLYSIRGIPVGGFVKIAGMDPEEEQDEHSYNNKPILARMLVIAAGSIMNFILPIILFFIIFISVGVDLPSNQPVIGSVLPDQPAVRAGIQPGDRLVAVNGAPIESWRQFVGIVQGSAGREMNITYERQGTTGSVALVPEYDAKANRGIIGVTAQTVNFQPGIGEAAKMAVEQTYHIATGMLTGIGQMITGKAPADVAGPLGVAQMAGEVAKMGFIYLLQFAALLSVNLGLINLLPVPVLDGGHIVTLAVEGVRGKRLSPGKMQFIQMVGFVLLMLLLLLATYKDITRFIRLM